VFGSNKTKGPKLHKIAKIGYSNLCLSQENLITGIHEYFIKINLGTDKFELVESGIEFVLTIK